MNTTDRHLSETQVLERFEGDPDSINPMYLFWSLLPARSCRPLGKCNP